MSKVFETDYHHKEELDNRTIFYLNIDLHDPYIQCIKYFNILKDEYPIGHTFEFMKFDYPHKNRHIYDHVNYVNFLEYKIISEPTYTDNNLEKPNCYFVEISKWNLPPYNMFYNRHVSKLGYFLIDIHNKKIISNYELFYDKEFFKEMLNSIFQD